MIKIAVHAALIAAVGHVHVHADGNTQVERALVHLRHEAHRTTPIGLSIGRSETIRIPCVESCATNSSASRIASAWLTSNSWQTLFAMMLSSGVRPSADCQMVAATSLSVNKLESTADITIISSPSLRAAIFGLRAMYWSLMPSSRSAGL